MLTWSSSFGRSPTIVAVTDPAVVALKAVVRIFRVDLVNGLSEWIVDSFLSFLLGCNSCFYIIVVWSFFTVQDKLDENFDKLNSQYDC